jgi:hypothetical protein
MSTYISLKEELELAAAGAKKRMERAQQAHADFHLEHDGQVISLELQQSFERERHLLSIELDEASRQCAKAIQDVCAQSTNAAT